MGQPKSPCQTKERRIGNLHEVVLGFSKKQNLEESRRCPQCAQPSCLSGCPLGVDIPGFIRLLREDDAASALGRIHKANPFPAICGRICSAPCEPACIFEQDGAPIAIRSLERYAADFGRAKTEKIKTPVVPSNGKKVAIIGSGPSGISAAHYLARAGYGVVVFESMDEPGGLLRYGVPEFRLPQKVLDEQINDLESLGVRFETNVFVGGTLKVEEIAIQGYAAMLFAVGAGVPDFAEIPGHNWGGVYYAEEFLLRAQSKNKARAFEQAGVLVHGLKTAVIGFGHSAVDAARLAARFGQQVHLIFGGLEEELGVHADDLKAAVEEGVIIQAPVEPLAITADEHGFAQAVQCRKLEIVEKEKKLSLEPAAEGETVIEAQTIILSHGRTPNQFLKQNLPQLKWNTDGTLWIDAQTGLTSVEKIFAAGNVVTGAGPMVSAIANGKQAAQKIMEFLNKTGTQ